MATLFPSVSKELLDHLTKSYPPLEVGEEDNVKLSEATLRFRLGQQSVIRLLKRQYDEQQRTEIG